jgi:hypothetical protein
VALWETGEVHSVLVERPDGKNHLEDLGVEGSIILKWTTKIR